MFSPLSVSMAQITITIDIDDEIGDISLRVDEIKADGLYLARNHTDAPSA